jgi:hypothetical protein
VVRVDVRADYDEVMRYFKGQADAWGDIAKPWAARTVREAIFVILRDLYDDHLEALKYPFDKACDPAVSDVNDWLGD